MARFDRPFCGLVFIVWITSVKSDRITENDVLEKMFLDAPNELLTRPTGVLAPHSEPTLVNFSMYIYRIDELDDENEELKLYLQYRTSWVDRRLSGDYFNYRWSSDKYLKHIILPQQYKIWTPDLVFKFAMNEEKYGDQVPQTFIFPDGTVEYASSELFNINCPMKSMMYPFDVQKCNLVIITGIGDAESYIQDADDLCIRHTYRSNKAEVLLKWRGYEPIILATISDALHTFISFHIDTVHYETLTGARSGISITFVFIRNFKYYFIKVYLPSTIAVLISWIPFCLRKTSAVRAVLVLATLLFISWCHFMQLNQLLFPYPTYMDLWRVVNFLFVLAAAGESVFVIHTLQYDTEYVDSSLVKTDQQNVEVAKMIQSNSKVKGWENVDRTCKKYFPSAYAVFITVYSIGALIFHGSNMSNLKDVLEIS